MRSVAYDSNFATDYSQYCLYLIGVHDNASLSSQIISI